MTEPIRLLLADDQALVRGALSALLLNRLVDGRIDAKAIKALMP